MTYTLNGEFNLFDKDLLDITVSTRPFLNPPSLPSKVPGPPYLCPTSSVLDLLSFAPDHFPSVCLPSRHRAISEDPLQPEVGTEKRQWTLSGGKTKDGRG
ncbi:hypothetical protein Hypma_013984 [Hypsizygus marmoreus]|uniref:Uncharacterized protein n=1 Tax=Hypsizygus marmoreus TaxID=39966 RepID=A0A369K694_HYPMA|nr:hypothetical protein Hypma_013984 [Hypsizygus marmoreus]